MDDRTKHVLQYEKDEELKLNHSNNNTKEKWEKVYQVSEKNKRKREGKAKREV